MLFYLVNWNLIDTAYIEPWTLTLVRLLDYERHMILRLNSAQNFPKQLSSNKKLVISLAILHSTSKLSDACANCTSVPVYKQYLLKKNFENPVQQKSDRELCNPFITGIRPMVPPICDIGLGKIRLIWSIHSCIVTWSWNSDDRRCTCVFTNAYIVPYNLHIGIQDSQVSSFLHVTNICSRLEWSISRESDCRFINYLRAATNYQKSQGVSIELSPNGRSVRYIHCTGRIGTRQIQTPIQVGIGGRWYDHDDIVLHFCC